MKKILKKFCIICICLFCIICQVFDNSVYADSIEEIKKNVNFKTVEEDGEPDSYDVLIDAQDLITDEKLPAGIKTTIEDVLYDNSGIFSIDFFGNDKTNSKSSSKKSKKSKKNKNSSSNDTTQEDKTAEKAKAIRSFVRNTYKVFLYIACGAMITVLIYMAVVTVTSGISPSLNILPFSSIINGKKGEKNPNQYMKSKRLVEQWVISVISLALAVFVMNLIVAFSDNIVNAMENKKVENESITVYVKNSKFAVNAPILGGSGSSGSTTTSTTTTSSGDAATLRQKVVDQAKSLDNLGASGGYCEMWVELVYRTALNRPEIPYQNCAHEAGQKAVNSSTSTDNIVPGAAVFSFRSSSGTVDSACGQDAGHVDIYIGDGQIASCTGRGSTGVVICTIDEWKQSWDFSCWGWLPGTEDLADGAVGDSNGSSGIQTKTVDYYFDTNLEGLLMFQSQYNSKEHPLKAGINMIAGMVVTFFKSVLYCIFISRTLLIAGISVITPILILINAFIKIGGGKSFIGNWIKLYLYLVLLRPVIAFVYYILIQSNVYLMADVPALIVLIIIGISALFIRSVIVLFRDFTGKKRKNAVSKS
ncbi:MAG: hypothetical protein V8R39_01640 [Clostridia bacterium]